MRIHSISLSWFRGAGKHASLILDGRSAVLYGPNGAGKSSFLDAVETTITNGKVAHLGHQYSGRNQEKGLINTDRPTGVPTSVQIKLTDGTVSSLTWTGGSPIRTEDHGSSISGWDYRRTALRQEELSDFIRATKGDKYSTVLPLLGLGQLERMAQNLHKLALEIERSGNLKRLEERRKNAMSARHDAFGDMKSDGLTSEFERLQLQYAPNCEAEDSQAVIDHIIFEIDAKIESLEVDQREAAAIAEIASNDVLRRISISQAKNSNVIAIAEPFMKERLAVLDATDKFSTSISVGTDTISCPSCGRDVDAESFQKHIAAEKNSLSKAMLVFEEYRVACSEVCDAIFSLQTVAKKPALTDWRESLIGPVGDAVSYVLNLNLQELRSYCRIEQINEMESQLTALLSKAQEDNKATPSKTTTLVTDKTKAKALKGLFDLREVNGSIKRVNGLIKLAQTLEDGVRDKVKEQARQTFQAISRDVQRYWKILQPGDKISHIRLEVPENVEKAIEIYLRFYGTYQDSPRLTLSEGQRNALGLCIFLAMANTTKSLDTPIILDDVIISFDRGHRSRVALLLQQEFSDRQILLLTHEREWHFELQRRLDSRCWDFLQLRPYLNPQNGIEMSERTVEFQAARVAIDIDPLEAMTIVRRIMDVALADIAEQLRLSLPYCRGDDNDHRTVGGFLTALEKAAKRSYRVKDGEEYIALPLAQQTIMETKPDLAIWANRSTHSFSVSQQEAKDLIDACEKTLGLFTCSDCKRHVGYVKTPNGRPQCECGAIQWKPT